MNILKIKYGLNKTDIHIYYNLYSYYFYKYLKDQYYGFNLDCFKYNNKTHNIINYYSIFSNILIYYK